MTQLKQCLIAQMQQLLAKVASHVTWAKVVFRLSMIVYKCHDD